MANFLKLTVIVQEANAVRQTYINMDVIVGMTRLSDFTSLDISGDEYGYSVRETPEEILKQLEKLS